MTASEIQNAPGMLTRCDFKTYRIWAQLKPICHDGNCLKHRQRHAAYETSDTTSRQQSILAPVVRLGVKESPMLDFASLKNLSRVWRSRFMALLNMNGVCDAIVRSLIGAPYTFFRHVVKHRRIIFKLAKFYSYVDS